MARVVIAEIGMLDPEDAVAALEAAGHEAVVLGTRDPREIQARAGRCDALIVAVAPVDAELIAALSELRVVATASVGVDHIDVAAATERGVAVCNIMNVASEEVAVHALAGMLSLLRELRPSAEQTRAGGWAYAELPLPPRVSELSLGLLGLGQIARQLAIRALPLFGRVAAYDPFVREEDWLPGVERIGSFEELLAMSNVLSLHAPSTPETHRVLNAEALALLPAGAYVVNVARGELVDEAALLAAIDSGRVRGAFLDVVDPEPPAPGSAILVHPGVVVTPHAAFRSAGSLRGYLMTPVENVIDVLAGRLPANRVNGG